MKFNNAKSCLSAGKVRYVRAKRTTTPLVVITNWQHGMTLPHGNTICIPTLAALFNKVIQVFADDGDLFVSTGGFKSDGEHNLLVSAFDL